MSRIPVFRNGQLNAAHMLREGLPDTVVTLGGDMIPPHDSDIDKLLDLRAYLPVIAKVSPEDLLLEASPTSWRELERQSFSLYEQTLGPFTFDAATYDQSTRIGRAARAAVGIITALFEVVPEYVHETERNAAGYNLAKSTLPMVLEWCMLSNYGDAILTRRLLAQKTGKGIRAFEDMHFKTDCFERVEDTLRLREDKVAQFKDGKNRHPSRHDSDDTVAFGCPARRHVLGLHRAMAKHAFNGQLFAQIP